VSGEEVVDPDHAVRELENIAAELHQSTPKEKIALRCALQEIEAIEREGLVARTQEDRERLLEFCENFMEANGLEERSNA
jgi:hypothetical protein